VTPPGVLLIDDHIAVRQALRIMLEAEADVRVVGEASGGAEGIDAAGRLQPDLAIVDLAMPGMGGLAAIPQLRRAAPSTAVLVFTMHHNTAYVHEAMRAGARGYVLKSAPKEELLAAIRALAAGGGYLQPAITGTVLRRLLSDARVAGERSPLTLREVQILETVADGKSNKEIAAALAIAEDTVKTHLRNLFEKLGAADRAQAVAIALRQNLID
jgi:DNA-binding NarL/FixJ family response regulator